MKFCIGITFYNPEPVHVKNVESYAETVDTVIVYDNTEEDSENHEHTERTLQKIGNVMYDYNKKNDGLSRAYNYFLEYSAKNDYDVLIILDQDTEVDSRNIIELKKKCEEYFDNQTALVAPMIHYTGSKRTIQTADVNVDYVISSGTCINVPIIINQDLCFDENLFIDDVDVDFCMNIKKKEMRIIQCGSIVLEQQLGNGDHRRNNHSVIRHYYMFRNDIYVAYKHYGRIVALLKSSITTVRHMFHIVLFENEKRKKIKMMIKAISDYRNRRMGKMSNG